MKKKMIKIIASFTCGLVAISFAPIFSTSCGSNEPKVLPKILPSEVYEIDSKTNHLMGFKSEYDMSSDEWLEYDTMVIPSNVVAIEDRAFIIKDYNYDTVIPTSIKTVDMSECTKLTVIGETSFGLATSLTNVIFSKALTNIGVSAFTDTYNIESLFFPDPLKSIGDCAFGVANFNEHLNLKWVSFPAMLQNIDQEAFENTSVLEKIIWRDLSETGPIASIGYMCFYGAPNSGKIVSTNYKVYSSKDLCDWVKTNMEGIKDKDGWTPANK